MKTDLHLHEQLLLLALRDDKGTLESKATMYQYALGGAILAEMALHGKIRIGSDKKKLVGLDDRRPFDEPVLDECLEMVAAAKKRRRASEWVSKFGRLKRLRHRVAEGLCRRGILKDAEDSVLLIFTRKVYPTIDPAPEARLLDDLRDAIFNDTAT
ncbi:MAG: GPP34 family phosphoprotein, partial [Acidobacteriota bacterium]|nr:GPP34 family phosphoprotein [Acidobacteriota bacterium]